MTHEKDERYTPPELVDYVRRLLGTVDLDPCTTYQVNRKGVNARKIYTAEDNGLIHPWAGRTFINPPGSAKFEFAQKLVDSINDHTVTAAIWLEYNWDHSTEAMQILLSQNPMIGLLKKRYKFSGYDVGRSQAFLIWGVPESAIYNILYQDAIMVK